MRAAFPTTRWTLVARVAHRDPGLREEALSELLSQSWYPLYVFLRRSGRKAEEIEDLIQGFYLRIIEKDLLSGVEERTKGRFRSFLLACLKNYVANEWKRGQAQKRGGGVKKIPLDLVAADERYHAEAGPDQTPQQVFDRAWAVTMIDLALEDVARRWRSQGKGQKFSLLKGCLTQPDPAVRGEAAARLGMSPGAVKTAVSRLRTEFRQSLCQRVAETLDRGDLLEDEINLLFSAISP